MEEDRMRLARIRTPENDEIGLLNFPIRARAASRAKNRRQTDDARGVSGAVAAIDVVTADDAAGELLREIVHFVGCLGATEQAEASRTMFRSGRAETRRSAVERFIPVSGPEDAVVANQWRSEPRVLALHASEFIAITITIGQQ
jgi:hypothetical protein